MPRKRKYESCEGAAMRKEEGSSPMARVPGQLQNVDREYINLINTANAPIFGIDVDGRVNIWNKRAAAITGFSREEVMGRQLVEDFITEDYRASVNEVLDNALKGNETSNYQFPIVTKDKRKLDVLLNATTRRDGLGNVIGVVGIGQDITELEKVREHNRLQNDLIHLLENSPSIVSMVLDHTGNFIYVSPNVLNMYGSTADELVGSFFFDRIQSNLLDGLQDDLQAFRENREGTEVSVVSTALAKFLGRSHYSVKHKDGHMVTIIGEMLIRNNRYFIREQNLQSEIDAQSVAEKQKYVARSAHDLKTPLTVLSGAMELLKETRLTSEQEDILKDVLTSLQFMRILIEEQLDFGRLYSGMELLPKRGTVSLPTLLSKIQTQIRGFSRSNSVKILYHLHPELSKHIISDEAWLWQILINYMTNAMKFTVHGFIELHLKRDGKWLLIQVHDTGIGLTQIQKEKLFKPFAQAQSHAGGTGVGLFNVKQKALKLGGSVGIDEREDKRQGCVFWVRIPYVPATSNNEDPDSEKHEGAAKERNGNTLDTPPSVLLVEDEPFITKMLMRRMTQLGCDVECAENGAIGLEKMCARAFDVVFVDFNMPVMGGPEMVKQARMKRNQSFVIGVSANSNPEDFLPGERAGMNGFMAKPVNFNLLRNVLDMISRKELDKVAELLKAKKT